MAADLLFVAAGLVLLVFAGDALVKGAVALALRLGIPALIVGLTVVAFGTSAPELLVSVNAALNDQAGIALGNVVGSNIANVLLILGLPALIATIHTSQIDTRRGYVVMLATAVLLILLSLTGTLVWWHGLILLAALALSIWDNIRQARAHRLDQTDDLPTDGQMPVWKVVAFIIGGLVGLAVGADLLVKGAVNIARVLGISETVIGLTLVAIGTSLPELVTSIMAAFRKQADVAIGNVIGSNIFNVLMILGATSLIAPLPVPAEILSFDLWVMLGVSLLLIPFIFFKVDIGKLAGIGLVGGYVAYAYALIS